MKKLLTLAAAIALGISTIGCAEKPATPPPSPAPTETKPETPPPAEPAPATPEEKK